MITEKFIPYDYSMSFAEQAEALLATQVQSWPILRNGVSSLSSVERELVGVGDFTFSKLFNAGRIVNIGADVSKQAIQERDCFLCVESLPPEQMGILLEDFLLLCNPRPIFSNHFTLSSVNHIEQSLIPFADFMLNVADYCGAHYTIFFNGSQAGASAPDHLHFQICPTECLPLVKALIDQADYRERVIEVLGAGYLFFAGSDRASVVEKLRSLIDQAQTALNCTEANLNVLVNFSSNYWQVVIIPRQAHRPACYYLTEDRQILLSPAAVEASGAIVTSRVEDYNRIDRALLEQVWTECFFPHDQIERL